MYFFCIPIKHKKKTANFISNISLNASISLFIPPSNQSRNHQNRFYIQWSLLGRCTFFVGTKYSKCDPMFQIWNKAHVIWEFYFMLFCSMLRTKCNQHEQHFLGIVIGPFWCLNFSLFSSFLCCTIIFILLMLYTDWDMVGTISRHPAQSWRAIVDSVLLPHSAS